MSTYRLLTHDVNTANFQMTGTPDLALHQCVVINIYISTLHLITRTMKLKCSFYVLGYDVSTAHSKLNPQACMVIAWDLESQLIVCWMLTTLH
jgi:hypothetical protein